jgi:predicted porin
MRKSLVAVALAVAFPAAFAQSNVTLYGIVDIGVEYLDAGRAPASQGSTNMSGTRVQSGISAGSRWGIRGSEELGGGYRALFTLENRFEADTGQVTNNNAMYWCKPSGAAASVVAVCPGIVPVTPLPPSVAAALVPQMSAVNNSLLQAITTVNSAGALFDRQSWAGLVTPYGAVLAGRQYTPGYEILNKFNIMGDQTSLQFGQGYTTLAIRANNAVQYRAEMKGFIGTFMYGFGGSEGSRNERATSPKKGDDFLGANLQYVAERWGVGFGYNRSSVVPYGTGTIETGLETYNLGAYYTFGAFKLAGQWMKRQNDHPILTPGNIQNLLLTAGANTPTIIGGLQLNPWDIDTMRGLAGPTDTNAYHLGASWRFGNGTFYGIFNSAKDTARSAWATQDAKANHFGLAYIHDLSRRTQVYAAMAWMNNGEQARISLSSAGYTTGWTTGAGQDANAYQMGIRHNF